ncbi:phage tail tape measure protein [Agromyces bauzanensis]
MFDAGALIFTIKAAGAQLFKQDLQQADRAIEKAGRSAQAAKPKVEQLGAATDNTGKKARAAKPPLEEQAKATSKVGDESGRAAPKQQEQAKASEQQAQSARSVGLALTAAGLAVTALVGLSVAKFATFDQAMSNTAAATMATADQQERLSEAALEAGADTAYSATQAAAAEEELAKAGLNVDQVIGGGLNASLALAAAGQLEVARSATIMATTLSQFGLKGSDAAHVADVLAAGAGKAQGSVDDLSNALKFAAPVANSLGLSLEETTGILALFAEQGIIGEQAGTSLRGVLSSLTSPSALAATELKKYHVELFEANGKMKTGAAIAQELHTAFAGLSDAERSQAMGRIFGNEQITAATILMRAGAEGVDRMTDAVNDNAYATDQAAKRQDNLAGDVEKLGGALDTALIKTGSAANDVLREMVQAVTALVDWYGELDPAVQGTVLGLGIATGAALLLSGGTLSLIGRFAALKTTLDGVHLTMGKTALIAGGVGIALTGLLAVVSLFIQRQAEAKGRVDELTDSLDENTGAITDNTRATVVRQLQDKGILEAAKALKIGLDDLTDAALGDQDAISRVNARLSELQGQQEASGFTSTTFAQMLQRVRDVVGQTNGELETSRRNFELQQEASEGGAEGAQSAAEAYLDAAGGAEELNSQLDELISVINEANGVGQDAISANIDYQDALAKVDEQIQKARDGVEGYGFGLDIATEAGRRNLDVLKDMAADSQAAAEKTFALDGNTANYRATLEAGRQALIDRAIQLGANADEAGALADEIYRIPSATEWEVIAKTQAAQDALDRFVWSNDGRTITLNVQTPGLRSTVGNDGGPGGFADGGIVEFYAGGGMREDHRAQFARAGAWRVWAEPETGGEAYIPLSPAKRGTSVPVLAEAAHRMGFDLVPHGARRFADGGQTVSTGDRSSSSAKAERHLHIHNPVFRDPVRDEQEAHDLIEASMHV